MHKHLGLLTLFLLAPIAAAPTAAADRETRQMMADIRMLQEQSQQLQNVLSSLADALKAVSTRLDSQTETTRKAFADQKLNGDALAADLRVVREKVDDGNVRIGSLTQEVDALRQSVMEINIAPPPPVLTDGTMPPPGTPAADGTIAAVGAAPNAPPAVAPTPAPVTRPTTSAAGMSPTKLWDLAFAEYAAGQYDLAVIGFESYIREFPRSEQADDAQVYIAAAYLNDGKNDRAIEAADMAIRTYPKGDTVPQAYFRKAQALTSLRRVDEARAVFELIVKTYPDSGEATLARQNLEALKRP